MEARHRVDLYRVHRSCRYVTDVDPSSLAQVVRRQKGSVFSDQALRALRISLQDSDAERRLLTAIALASLGPVARKAEPDLEVALSDNDERVRKALCNALGVIGFEKDSTIAHLKRSEHSKPTAGNVGTAVAGD